MGATVKFENYRKLENCHIKSIPNNDFFRDQVISSYFKNDSYHLTEVIVKLKNLGETLSDNDASDIDDKIENFSNSPLENILTNNEYNVRDNIYKILSPDVKITLARSDTTFPVNSDLVFVFEKQIKSLNTNEIVTQRSEAFKKLEQLIHIDPEEVALEKGAEAFENEMQLYMEMSSKVPATLILDDITMMTPHELNRHLSIAKTYVKSA